MREKLDISFVVLTWNSASDIEACLKSFAEVIGKAKFTAEFLVADNGSNDQTLKILEGLYKEMPFCFQLRIIRLKVNKGTTLSRNLALRRAIGEIVIICDSDTEFISGEIKEALDLLEKDPLIGIIAPRLVYENGAVQPSVKRFPTLGDKLLKLRKIFFGIKAETDFYGDFPWDSPRSADSAISAFWLFKRELLEMVGYLDEKIFYAPEDLDYCLRVWEAGKKVMYYPDLVIKHKTQQITHKNPFSRHSLSHFWGLLYYFWKHKYLLSRTRLYKRLNIGSLQKGSS